MSENNYVNCYENRVCVWLCMIAVFVMYLTDVCSDRFTMARQDLVGNSGAARARRDSDAV